MDSKEFLKYLKNNNFPLKNYNAKYNYPNTQKINGKYINDFNIKYEKKKFLHIHEDKNIVNNESSNRLFDNSLEYVSLIQNNLLNKNIESYISGGTAYKLHSYLIDAYNKIFHTKDIDLYLYIDEKTIKTKTILENFNNIINSIVEINPNQNYAFLEFYLIVNFESIKKLDDVIKIFIDQDFDLFLYEFNEKLNFYDFKFLKLLNKEFCIRIKIRVQNIERLIKEKIYGFSKITYYHIEKINNEFKTISNYIPIELLFKSKQKSNIEIMKSSLKYNNNIFYLYNLNSLLYNLLHINYKYKYNTENITIEKKKEQKKNKRDEKRLKKFFKIYCKILYPKLKLKEITNYYNQFQSDIKKFKKSIEHIKNFDVINNIFLN